MHVFLNYQKHGQVGSENDMMKEKESIDVFGSSVTTAEPLDREF